MPATRSNSSAASLPRISARCEGCTKLAARYASSERLAKGELLRRWHDALTPDGHSRRPVGRSPHRISRTAHGTPTLLGIPLPPCRPPPSSSLPAANKKTNGDRPLKSLSPLTLRHVQRAMSGVITLETVNVPVFSSRPSWLTCGIPPRFGPTRPRACVHACPAILRIRPHQPTGRRRPERPSRSLLPSSKRASLVFFALIFGKNTTSCHPVLQSWSSQLATAKSLLPRRNP